MIWFSLLRLVDVPRSRIFLDTSISCDPMIYQHPLNEIQESDVTIVMRCTFHKHNMASDIQITSLSMMSYSWLVWSLMAKTTLFWSCWVSLFTYTHFLARPSPKWLTSTCAHSFIRNWQLPFLNQQKGENDHRKYFMINLHETEQWPQWLSWMRRPTGDQEVAGSTPAEVSNILSWRLIAQYWLTA